jgi:hypothetical protein
MMAGAGTGGFTIDAERAEDRATCDRLVNSGHLVAVEDVDGDYALSEELAASLGGPDRSQGRAGEAQLR